MKKYLILPLLLTLVACGESGTDATKSLEPTKSEFEALQLAYIGLNQDGTAADCKNKVVGVRSYSACRFTSLNGNSMWQVWYYDNQKDPTKRFYALNGTARSTYDSHFKSNELLGDFEQGFGLPLPSDIKIDEVVSAFGE